MAAQAVAPPLSPQPPPPAVDLGKASLYVGDLDPQVTEIDLVKAFTNMGPLVSVRLCRDRLSQISLRYGYINFFSPSDASKALACLNHTELKGKPIRVMWCQRDPLTRKTGVGNVFIKNLDPSITNALLEGIFCKFGTILSCKVAEERRKSKGFGFVQFASEDSSMAAVNALHGTMLEGKELYVSKFLKRNERKEAYEEPKFTNLYVKNLGEDVTEDTLREKFSEFGKVCNVLIMKDAEGKSRGFGFVNFESHEEAKTAVEALNGAVIGSEKLFVGKAQKKAERKELLKREYKEMTNGHTIKPKASNLYVKNFDVSIDDRKLEEHFSSFGKVTSAKVMRHDNGVSKGFGFVSFSIPDEAKKALDALNGTIFQGRSLYVAIAQPKEERNRELLSYYAQYAQYPLPSFCSSDSDIFSSPYLQTYNSFPAFPILKPVSRIHSHQPMMYQHDGKREGDLYPFMPQSYQRNVSTYKMQSQIPERSQQKSYMDYVYQHPMRYPNSSVLTRELNYGSRKDLNTSWNKRSSTAASFKQAVAKKCLTPAPSLGKCKQNLSGLLQPAVENLQPGRVFEMHHSDARKLLKLPMSSAVHMLNDTNSRMISDGHVAQPAKSAQCLSY
ncbi:Polyadenylate-binding protein like [Actinidia chinensis var. chinensis]|uniref:Polyadenylate-binding protein like n=1 Tax=Actinidia chinensis var. chinensis TaxID=1590841 RepID=A0A2R6QFH5_ACTCC|nr:Polyadenylate-binding protein like [Actinidia chinensis var. chinensis]